jgi:hypothetical protein
VTFKDLKKIIAEKSKEMERESKLYNRGYYWKGKEIVTLVQWLQINQIYGLKAALQYFPNDFPSYGFPYVNNIQDQTLKQEAEQWYSDFVKLMKRTKNPEYGKKECYHCLLSAFREEAAIFVGINKVISRALDINGTSVYPCKVLNRFACPYDKKTDITKEEEEDITGDSSITKKPVVDELFYLSEIAFAVELAPVKAQEEGSMFRIKSAADTYQVLTSKETLEKVLQQGLKEEHIQYKDRIVDLFTNMKDRIKVEDLRVY